MPSPKAPCKRKRRETIRHVKQRSDERYSRRVSDNDLDGLLKAVRLGYSIRCGRNSNEYFYWTLSGVMVKFVYVKQRGIVTLLPLRGDELKFLNY